MHWNPIWPWPIIALIVAALCALIAFVYWPRLRSLSPTTRWGLLGFRLAALAVLVFAMLRPEVERDREQKQKFVLLVVADASRSMQTKDGPGKIPRRAAIIKALTEAKPEFDQLAERIEIRYFDFGESFRSVQEFQPEAQDELTRFDGLLDALVEETDTGERFLGVMLMTDGSQRPSDTKPVSLLASARRLVERRESRRIPIYPIAFGDPDVSQNTRDVQLESLVVDPRGYYLKNLVEVEATVKADAAKGENITLRLKIEDRSNAGEHEPGEMKAPSNSGEGRPVRVVRIPQGADSAKVRLSFLPQVAGSYKISIEADPINGELRTENNRIETLITVLPGGLRVAYFDRLRPEQKFLRAIGDNKVQLDYFLVQDGPIKSAGIDESLFADDRYNVIIIGDVPASAFNKLSSKLLPAMAKRVRAGAGLLMTGGENSFTAGGYAKTTLAPYIPIDFDKSGGHHEGEYRMLPTREGLKSYVMKFAGSDNENRKLWGELEKLEGANVLFPKSTNVEPWAESDIETNIDGRKDRLPLLLSQEIGATRTVAFAADSTWLWHLGGAEKRHLQFWQQLILWLAHQDTTPDHGPWVKVNPRNFTPEKSIPIEFGAKDQNSKPLKSGMGKRVSMNIRVIGPNGLTKTFKRDATQLKNLLVLKPEMLAEGDKKLSRLPAGDYWVEVTGTVSPEESSAPESLGTMAKTRFIVNSRDVELDDPDADPGFLKLLATETGGKSLKPEEMGEFLRDRLAAVKADPDSRPEPIWDHWLLLAAFVMLMTAEWAWRKAKGLV